MQVQTLTQSLGSTQDSFRAYADTTEGVARIRLALIALAMLAYARPDHPQAWSRQLASVSLGFQWLIVLGFIVFLVPGLMCLTIWFIRCLLWILRELDACLFFIPRILLRRHLGLGVAASFGLALSLELAIIFSVARYTASAFKVQTGTVVPNGVYQPQKHGRQRYRNMFPGGRPPRQVSPQRAS